MIEVWRDEVRYEERQSSKGNQMKWFRNGMWYKADYTGYEGLVEYVVSTLLGQSTLPASSYQSYMTEQIQYGVNQFLGCKSAHFLPEGCQLITLERLFQNAFGQSLNQSIYRISHLEERMRFLVTQTERLTGLKEYGKHLSMLMTIDAFFMNEDRHTHNMAVILDHSGKYQYCPIFDNGGCLLSDTTLDYPINVPVEQLMPQVRPKTFCQNFDEQLDTAEKLYGQQLRFQFTLKDIEKLLQEEPYYNQPTKDRVLEILRYQSKKYAYLFNHSF